MRVRGRVFNTQKVGVCQWQGGPDSLGSCVPAAAAWLCPQQPSLGCTGTHQLTGGCIAQQLLNDGAACGQGGWEAGEWRRHGGAWLGWGVVT